MKFEPTDLNVDDKTSFIKFLILLKEDFIKNGESWENQNLPDFLEAIASYTEDIQGFYDNTGQNIESNEPSWKLFADILKGATIYE